MIDQPMTLTDYLADLTGWHTHAEPVHTRVGLTNVSYRHRTKVPPLLIQLEKADASAEKGARSGAGYESRPAAPLDAVAALAWIDEQAARWVRRLGWDDPGDTMKCVRLLSGLAAGTDHCGRGRATVDRETREAVCCTRHRIEADARRWWTHARIVTGWDSPAWRPDATCPECGRRGGLRIRLEDRTGTCVECHVTWGHEDYQALADHVRAESAAERAAARPAACSCMWPRAVFDLGAMCPRCGSTTCVNAIRSLGARHAAG